MTQHNTQTPPPDSPRRLSGSMIAALGILALSLIGSAYLISQAFLPPATDTPAPPTTVPDTQVPQDAVPDAPTPTISAPVDGAAASADIPVSEEGRLVVRIVALTEGADPAITQRLVDATNAAMQEAFFSAPPQALAATLPVEGTTVESIDPRRDAPNSALLVVWEEAGDGAIAVYLFSASEPLLARVDEEPRPWPMYAPEGIALHVGRESDMAYAGVFITGTLQLSSGTAGDAIERLQNLQTMSSGAPLELEGANRAVVQFAVAQALAAHNDLAGALQTFSQALRVIEDFPAAHTDRGNIYLALGDTTSALAAYDLALALAPDSPAGRYDHTLALLLAGDLAGAGTQADQLVASAPDSVWSHHLSGLIAYEQEDYAGALADFEAAAAADPSAAMAVFNQGATLFALGDYEEALVRYDAALDLEPNNPVFHLYRGMAFQANGDLAPAERAYNRAVELGQGYVDAYVSRAYLQIEMGDYESALADAEQALALDPEDGRGYAAMGQVRLAMEQFGDAERAFTQAITRGEETVQTYAGRAQAWHRQYYYQTAILDYEKALALGADDPRLLYLLGFAYFDFGRYADALDAFLGAINGGYETADAQAGLALALDANLQRDEAVQAFARAIELDAQYRELDYIAVQPFWSQGAVSRAQTILSRLDAGS